MSRLPFASLAFFLFLVSNFGVSDSLDLKTLSTLVYKAIQDAGIAVSKAEVKVIDVNCKYSCISKSFL